MTATHPDTGRSGNKAANGVGRNDGQPDRAKPGSGNEGREFERKPTRVNGDVAHEEDQ
ncbi:hypothetical protein [Tessaracoccus massiliensis]|uniref:hypothetical protein n=1 Tax=Tessaracoccus massiliensis TaxID=1522311 RepID=UPI0015D58FD0|nr:hypothetical protein [Tessaracoccus massiliensis]